MINKKKVLILFFLSVIIVLISSCKSQEKNFIEYSENLLESTVFILATNLENNIVIDYSWGTGVIINEEGYILTASHVLEGFEDRIFVLFIDSYGTCTHYYEAKRKNIDLGDERDLAIIKIDIQSDHPLTYVKIYEKDVKIGSSVAFTGFPWTAQWETEEEKQRFIDEQITPFLKDGIKPTQITKFLNEGIISSTFWSRKKEKSLNYYYLNSLGNRGDSGGPVFLKSNGQVIGLIHGGPLFLDILSLGVSKVTPINDIPNILEKLK